MGVLALEGEAVQAVAVDAAFGIALDAQAAALEVFGLGVAHPGEVGDHDPAGPLQQPLVSRHVVVRDRRQPRTAIQLSVDSVGKGAVGVHADLARGLGDQSFGIQALQPVAVMAQQPGQVAEARRRVRRAAQPADGKGGQRLAPVAVSVQQHGQGRHRVGVGRGPGVEGGALVTGGEDVLGEVVDPAQRPREQGAHDLLRDSFGEVLAEPPRVRARPRLPGRAPQRVGDQGVGDPAAVGPQHAHRAAVAVRGGEGQPLLGKLAMEGVKVLSAHLGEDASAVVNPGEETAYAAEVGADAGDGERQFAGRGVLGEQGVEQALGRGHERRRNRAEVQLERLAVGPQPRRRQPPRVVGEPGRLLQPEFGAQRSRGQHERPVGHRPGPWSDLDRTGHASSFGPSSRSSGRTGRVWAAAARCAGLNRGRMSRVKTVQVTPCRAVH